MKFSKLLSTAALVVGIAIPATAQSVTINAPWTGGAVNILPPQTNIGGNALSQGGTIYASIRLYAGADSGTASAAGLLTYGSGPVQTFEASQSAMSGSSGQWTYVGSQTGVVFDNVYAGSNVPTAQIIDPVDAFGSVTATAYSSCSGIQSKNSVVSHVNGGSSFSTGGTSGQQTGTWCGQFYDMYTATNSVILLRGYGPNGYAFLRLGATASVSATLTEGPGC
ncbi:MAG: hypothetical protein KDE27_12625 [Planctomycetes bacterium]|nr:hypothetical protein [Planctomycetota bacterium]